jgi:hypothetical protein
MGDIIDKHVRPLVSLCGAGVLSQRFNPAIVEIAPFYLFDPVRKYE